jgi:hypothetical protein
MNPNLNATTNNKSFGLLVSGIFIFLTVFYWLQKDGATTAWVLFVVAITLLLITLFSAQLFTPFTKAWISLGNILGYLTRPLILGFIFYLLISPIAILTRTYGRDVLRLKRKNKPTYWLDRLQPELTPESFHDQF